MMRSIRERIVFYFLILAISTIFLFEIYTFYTVKHYYYSSIQGVMESEMRNATELYSSYLSDYHLGDVIIEDRSQFYRQLLNHQVQILSNSGIVLYDSIASPQTGQELETEDVLSAKEGEDGVFIGEENFYSYKVLSVTSPLIARGKQVGILRIVTSLDQVDQQMNNRFIAYLGFGILALIISGVLSFLMAQTIVRPIQDLTKVAVKLSDGQMNIRANENEHDEIGKLGKTLNLMTDNIQENEKMKNEFISSISHELRTPLTSIHGWTQTLLYDLNDHELLEQGLEIIDSETTRLSNLVEDLLDFSRFTSGQIKMKKEVLNFKEIIQDMVNQLTPRALTSGIDLIANYGEDPVYVLADPNRMKQVLINLIDNAIKFTETGGTIVVDLTEDEDYVIFSVVDTGIGIAQDELKVITEKFYKGESSMSHTGLGLSICEEIVKLHNGKMIIKSKLGEGTTVTVYIAKEDYNE